jgi:hypothetical protein
VRNAGAWCPETVGNYSVYCDFVSRKNRIGMKRMRKREGWAYTMPTDLLYSLPPIPTELTMFYGDDWLYRLCKRNHRYWVMMKGNFIYHKVGMSVKEIPGGARVTRPLVQAEKEIYLQLIAKHV